MNSSRERYAGVMTISRFWLFQALLHRLEDAHLRAVREDVRATPPGLRVTIAAPV